MKNKGGFEVNNRNQDLAEATYFGKQCELVFNHNFDEFPYGNKRAAALVIHISELNTPKIS